MKRRTGDRYYDDINSIRCERKTKKRKSSKKESEYEDDEFDECENIVSARNNNVFSDNNHIYFHSNVNKKSIEMLIDEIRKINEKFEKIQKNELVEIARPKPIYLHITSYGGSLFHCFKAIDVINRSKIEVHTVVEGYAASCGSLLSVIGKKRYMGRHAIILMHQLSSGAMGKYREIEDEYQSCKMFMEHIINLYEQHTTMTREEIEQQLDHDSWWNFETCRENGLIDEEWLG